MEKSAYKDIKLDIGCGDNKKDDTWAYFTPSHPLYKIYKPKPWVVKYINWTPDNMELILTKTK